MTIGNKKKWMEAFQAPHPLLLSGLDCPLLLFLPLVLLLVGGEPVDDGRLAVLRVDVLHHLLYVWHDLTNPSVDGDRHIPLLMLFFHCGIYYVMS